jgi:hypothetical protein
MTEPKNILPVIPVTKEAIHESAAGALWAINEGHISPEDVFVQYKALEKFLEALKPDLNKLVLTEAEKYGKEGFIHKGLKICFGEYGHKVDYTVCGDPVWERLKQDLADRETFLKSLKEPHTYVDEDTGEAITLMPPHRTSTTVATGSFK